MGSPAALSAGDPASRVLPHDSATVTVAASTKPITVSPGKPLRIRIAAIGYSADVRSMKTDKNGDVNPPTLDDAYLITDRGTLPSSNAQNTVYVACHSYGKGYAPCNEVYQKAKGIPKSKEARKKWKPQYLRLLMEEIKKGQCIKKSSTGHCLSRAKKTHRTWLVYKVMSADHMLKAKFKTSRKVTAKVPGRLVLVTCRQPGGSRSSTENSVVFAQFAWAEKTVR